MNFDSWSLERLELSKLDTSHFVSLNSLEFFRNVNLSVNGAVGVPKLRHWSYDDFLFKIQCACHLGHVLAFKLLICKLHDMDDDEVITAAWLMSFLQKNRPDYYYVFNLASLKAIHIS